MTDKLNLRHVEAFRAVMIAGSVVGAAELLSVTQPAVSRTIAHLEARLGFALFHRKGRRLTPTTEGEALFREVEQLYGGIERIAHVAEDLRHHRAGAMRLAVLPALSQWLVPRLLADFLAQRPQVTVFVQSLPSRQIADLVATGQFDLGVIELPLAKAGVQVEPLADGEIVAVIPSGHRLAARREVGLVDLAGERLILPSSHSYVRYKIDDAFNQHGLNISAVAETATSTMAFALAAAGAGIALVSRWVPEPAADPRYVVRPLTVSIRSQYGTITRAHHPVTALAGEFTALLRGAMRARPDVA